MEFELGERPITIGRSAEADLVILDEKASRIHCGIRRWDGDFFIKDLKSRNGTFVNGERIDMVKLNGGDRIRVGATSFSFELSFGKGDQTILQEVANEMSGGKGYTTLLREIIDENDQGESPAANPEVETPIPSLAPSFDAVVRLPAAQEDSLAGTRRIRVQAKNNAIRILKIDKSAPPQDPKTP